MTQETHEVMLQFEKNIKDGDILAYIPAQFEKEDKDLWRRQSWYKNGQVNAFFQCYYMGYAYSKTKNRE